MCAKKAASHHIGISIQAAHVPTDAKGKQTDLAREL